VWTNQRHRDSSKALLKTLIQAIILYHLDYCMMCLTATSGSCSQSRTLPHVWLLVPDGVIISHQFCGSYTGCHSGEGLTIKCHAWCTSHCRAMHPGTWLTTSTLSSTAVVVYFDQHMTGHARYLGLTPASATEVSASLDHVCGTHCCHLCNKILAMDSLSVSEWVGFNVPLNTL